MTDRVLPCGEFVFVVWESGKEFKILVASKNSIVLGAYNLVRVVVWAAKDL